MSTDNPNGRPSMVSDYSDASVNPRLGTRYEGGGGSQLGFDSTSPVSEGTNSLGEVLRVLRRRIWAILLAVIVLLGTSTGFSLVQTPTYEASVTILIGQKASDVPTGNLSSRVEGLQQLTATMAEAVTTLPVAQEVAEQLDMPPGGTREVLANLSAQADPNTTFIEVSYRDTDPQRAQQTVNTVGQVFSGQVSEVSPVGSAVTATVWEPAVVPGKPVSPDLPANALVALVLGLLLGVGLAFLLERLDDSWDSPEEVEQVSGVPTVGAIPSFKVFVTAEEKGEK